MTITVDPEFRDMIPPLTEAERASLEASIAYVGSAHTPVVVWLETGILLDGHNRYEICTRLGLPYTTRAESFPDRDTAKAWLFENQIARRNLTPDQVIMLAAIRGVASDRGTARQRTMAAELAKAGKGGPVLGGRLSLALAYGAHARATGLIPARPYTPRPPRGPSTAPAIPEGHELAGVSTLTGPDGETKAEWNKTRVAGADEAPTDPMPPGFLLDKVSTMQRGDGTTVVQWTSASPEKIEQWEGFKAAIVEHVRTYVRAAAPILVPDACEDDLLSAYMLGDPHVGLLAWAAEVGEHFDLRIGERELCECMRQLVARSPASKQALVVNLGDFWHAQDQKQATPKGGNRLDVDGRFGKVGRVGLSIATTLVDAALTKHETVGFRALPGNHDPEGAFSLSEYMRAWYRNDPRVVIHDPFNPYQYDVFGNSLLAWHHGDGAKMADLGGVIAADVPKLWGEARYRYANIGHVHHWSEKELRGIVVNSHRTLAGRDAWHHHSGYRSDRALKMHVYHREWGLDDIKIVGIERVRAALKGINV
jgi:hypothetical protein